MRGAGSGERGGPSIYTIPLLSLPFPPAAGFLLQSEIWKRRKREKCPQKKGGERMGGGGAKISIAPDRR